MSSATLCLKCPQPPAIQSRNRSAAHHTRTAASANTSDARRLGSRASDMCDFLSWGVLGCHRDDEGDDRAYAARRCEQHHAPHPAMDGTDAALVHLVQPDALGGRTLLPAQDG